MEITAILPLLQPQAAITAILPLLQAQAAILPLLQAAITTMETLDGERRHGPTPLPQHRLRILRQVVNNKQVVNSNNSPQKKFNF
jgi:hypothetical protein